MQHTFKFLATAIIGALKKKNMQLRDTGFSLRSHVSILQFGTNWLQFRIQLNLIWAMHRVAYGSEPSEPKERGVEIRHLSLFRFVGLNSSEPYAPAFKHMCRFNHMLSKSYPIAHLKFFGAFFTNRFPEPSIFHSCKKVRPSGSRWQHCPRK